MSVWCLLGSDMILILLSYCFILRAVLHLQAGGAATKALSTCGSHLILILFFYTVLLVFIFTNKAEKKVPSEVPILLNVLHHLIPPALNPIVYGVRTQEIKQGIIKLFKDHYWEVWVKDQWSWKPGHVLETVSFEYHKRHNMTSMLLPSSWT